METNLELQFFSCLGQEMYLLFFKKKVPLVSSSLPNFLIWNSMIFEYLVCGNLSYKLFCKLGSFYGVCAGTLSSVICYAS
jgi:hypothetical protein